MVTITVLIFMGFMVLIPSRAPGQEDALIPCLPEGITFTSQAQVDGFPSDFPGCTMIGGDVLIEGGDITHLDSLHALEDMEGYL